MGNYKVRVNSEAESREAQELFFQLGYEKGACSEGNYPADIIAVPRGFFTESPFSSRSVKLDHEQHEGFNKVTLPELRDMVVLKRNDVGDATHQDKDDAEFKYRLINNQWHLITDGNPEWRKSSITLEESPLFIKPIEKTMNILDTGRYEQPSLNDQYAEIEQVRQTLNERQSQYGSFKDVADTTAVFMDQFAIGRMSNVQREALHMICSKLARIANGDPNHVDSWHDIAGYATLVVDDLES